MHKAQVGSLRSQRREKREEWWWKGNALHYKTTLPPTVSAPSLTREGVKRFGILKVLKPFENSFIVVVILFFIVQRVPNLRKEGIDFGFGIIIPRPR